MEGGTSCHIWTGLAPLFHLVLMVVSLEDISRLLWISQHGATSHGVSLCSQWNMFPIWDIVSSLIHLQLSQSYSSIWERTSINLVMGMTSWLADMNEEIFFGRCCDGICRDMSPHQQVHEALRPLEVVAVVSTLHSQAFYSSLKSLLGRLEVHTPCFTPWKNQSNLVVHPPP